MSPETRQQIKFEIKNIIKEKSVLVLILPLLEKNAADEIQLRAAAAALHAIYNGIEKSLLKIIKDLGLPKPSGKTWHSDLLKTAQQNNIISSNLHNSLKELMSFRHFFRNAYGFMIELDLITPLVQEIDQIIDKFQTEMNESA